MKNTPLVIVFVILMLSGSCKKKDRLSENILLKDKPLSEIQRHITGKWKLLYAFGGFTGHIRYDFVENYIVFYPDSISWHSHDTIVAVSPIEWVPIEDIWGKKTIEMRFYDRQNYPYGFIPDRIENGQLWLVENFADGFGYFLERSR